MRLFVVEIEIADIWLDTAHFHNWHAWDGVCLNQNFVRIRFSGASWELTVTEIYVVNHCYHEAYFCEMINHLLV